MTDRERLEAAGYKINNAGFVDLASRNWGYRGDKGSYARVDSDGNASVVIATKGIVSSAYRAELDAVKAVIA